MELTPMKLPREVALVMETLNRGGYDAYVVGGCVRDHIMGIPPHDFDMTTDATPSEMLTVFQGHKVIETGLKHGTVTVLVEGTHIEVTTYRVDGVYPDHRHPDEVTFTRSLTEDLARRDFTTNAIAYSPKVGYVDPFHGVEDIESKTLRAVGEPQARFEEDALRILRGVRFASTLGFALEPDTVLAMYEKLPLLAYVSAERVREELTKLLLGEHVVEVLLTYHRILSQAIPEIGDMVATGQNSVYHIYSVWEHTARVVGGVPPTVVLRWSALLHDVAKPPCRFVGEDGRDHFYGHPQKSAEMAEAILRRLKFDNKGREQIVTLVAHHDDRPKDKRLTALRLLEKIGYPLAYDLCHITIADSGAQNPCHPVVQEAIETAKRFRALLDRLQEEGAAYRVSDLAITGEDLAEIGFPRGPKMGETLHRLLHDLFEERVENTRESLLARAKKLYLE